MSSKRNLLSLLTLFNKAKAEEANGEEGSTPPKRLKATHVAKSPPIALTGCASTPVVPKDKLKATKQHEEELTKLKEQLQKAEKLLQQAKQDNIVLHRTSQEGKRQHEDRLTELDREREEAKQQHEEELTKLKAAKQQHEEELTKLKAAKKQHEDRLTELDREREEAKQQHAAELEEAKKPQASPTFTELMLPPLNTTMGLSVPLQPKLIKDGECPTPLCLTRDGKTVQEFDDTRVQAVCDASLQLLLILNPEKKLKVQVPSDAPITKLQEKMQELIAAHVESELEKVTPAIERLKQTESYGNWRDELTQQVAFEKQPTVKNLQQVIQKTCDVKVSSHCGVTGTTLTLEGMHEKPHSAKPIPNEYKEALAPLEDVCCGITLSKATKDAGETLSLTIFDGMPKHVFLQLKGGPPIQVKYTTGAKALFSGGPRLFEAWNRVHSTK